TRSTQRKSSAARSWTAGSGCSSKVQISSPSSSRAAAISGGRSLSGLMMVVCVARTGFTGVRGVVTPAVVRAFTVAAMDQIGKFVVEASPPLGNPPFGQPVTAAARAADLLQVPFGGQPLQVPGDERDVRHQKGRQAVGRNVGG